MIRAMVLTLFLGLAFALPAPAQNRFYDNESMEAKTEFLRNLRRKGYTALAKEFTEQLIKTATPADLPFLNLELARTSVSLAKEKPLSQRQKYLDESRAAFAAFITANPNSFAGAQARLEIADLLTTQATMRLNKAMTGEDEETREKGALEARNIYEAADAEYDAAVKILNAVGKKKDAVAAEFDRALNLLEKANAFINTENSDQNRKRALTVAAATKIFAEFAKDKESVNGLLANAYLVKCYQEGQDPPKMNEHINVVANAKGQNAIPAQRVAFYYDILFDKTRPDFKGDRLKSVVDRTNEWLKMFPTAKTTYHGEHLRFEQAICYLNFAATMTDGFKKEKYDKMKSNAKEKATFEGHLANSDKIAKDLQSENGDFSERGAGLHNQIEYLRITLSDSSKPPAGFDGALLIAKLKFQEASKAREAGKAGDAAKLFLDGQILLAKAITQGQQEAVTAGKLHEAQFLLGSAFYGINDKRRSAISFEALARANPPSKKSAEAAAQAIKLYKECADEEQDGSARYFLHELGDYVLSPNMQRIWAEDPISGIARYFLAMDYVSEEKYKEALEHLSKLPKDYPAYVYAQGQSVFISLKAREKADTTEERKPWTDAAKASLGRLGPIPVGADPTTTLMWFTASLEGPKFLYADAAAFLRDNKVKEAAECYDKMAKNIAEIDAAFKKEGDKLAPERKEAVDFTIQVLRKYTHLGAADVEYRKGNYAKVLEDAMLGGLTKEIFEIGLKNPKADIPVVDVKVIGESLSLVLRSFVQLGKLDEAKSTYNLLMRIKAKSGEAQDNANFTRALIKDLADQVEEMKEKNEAAKLKNMVNKFTLFGDALAKTLVYDNKTPDLRDVKNLARFYTGLDQFKKGADLFKVVPEPKFLNQKGLKATEDQDRELYIYWDFQLEYANLLRKSKDFEGANKVFNSIINHPNARGQTYAKRDQILIYEDKELFGPAIKLRKAYMDDLQRADIGKNKRIQEMYFDAFYDSVLMFYKLSQSKKATDEGKSDLYLNQSASMIVRLETANDPTGWQLIGPRLHQLMEKEKKIKTAYDSLKKKSK